MKIMRFAAALLGQTAARTEMHVVNDDAQHVAGTTGHGELQDYQVACMLAQSVGIELEG